MNKYILHLSLVLSVCRGENDFTIKEILSAPFPSNLIVSKNSKKVAWIYNKKGVRNIWIAHNPKYIGYPITKHEKDIGEEITSLIFTPNGNKIIFVRGAGPNRKGEIPNPTSSPDWPKQEICIISSKGGPITVLDEGSYPQLSSNGEFIAYIKKGQVWSLPIMDPKEKKQQFVIRGIAASLRWSPDNKKLAFVSKRGDHSFIGIYHFDLNQITYLSPSVDNDQEPAWSMDSQHIAFIKIPNEKRILPFEERRTGLPWSIHIGNSNTGKTKMIWKAKEGIGSVFRSISSNNQIFWAQNDQIIFPYEGNGWTHLYSIPTKGGEPKLLTPGKSEVQFVSLGANRKKVYFSSNQNDIDRQHVWVSNLKDSKPKQITKGKGIEWAPIENQKGELFIFASNYNSPAHPYIVDKTGKMISLAKKSIPESFPTDFLNKPEQIKIRASDGIEIHGQLFLPSDYNENKKYPALLYFHGGSRRQMLLGFHHRGYYHNAFAMNQYLANQGYMVLSVNYRSGIGYGMEFREALNYGANGASEYKDVIAAALYLKSRKDVNTSKIGLWGGSYGGYLTAMGLARNSDIFAAGVDIHGVHNWNVVIKNFRPNYNSEQRKKFANKAFDSSPLAFIDSWKSPVLLIHGDDDRNVPFSESVDLVESLRKKKVYFEQLIFPDEVHGFLLHNNWVLALEATDDFFKRMLD
tara:strand:- start:111 stop:2177 length:2067 start_codon:yes stop_codon:yes gene_type:complete